MGKRKKDVMRFAALERVSTEKQETGTSLERQHTANEKDAQEIAKGFGKTAKVEHFRGSESGAEHSDHPRVEKMVFRCESGEFDAVIVQAVDRFARGYQAIAWWERLKAVRVRFYVKQEPRTKLNQMWQDLRLLMASSERDAIIERTWEGRKHRQSEGIHVIGKAPVGYRFDEKKKLFVVDRTHKSLIRKALRKYLTTDIGFQALADEIRKEWKEKFPNKYRNVSAHTLQRILEVTGARTEWSVSAKMKDKEWDQPVLDEDGNHAREVLYTYDLTKGGGPILSKEEAETVKKKARLNRSYVTKKDFRVYPLVGVLLCDNCKGTMRGTGSKGFLYYKHLDEQQRQRDGGCIDNLRADKLEKIVFGWVERILTGRYPLKQAIENEIRTRDKTLQSLEQQEADLAETVNHLEDKYRAAADTFNTVRSEKARKDFGQRVDKLAEQLEPKQQDLNEVRERLDAIRKPVDESLLVQAEELLARSFGKRKLNQLNDLAKRRIIQWLIGADDSRECREKNLGVYLRPGEVIIKCRLGLIKVVTSDEEVWKSSRGGERRRIRRVQPRIVPDLEGLARLLLDLDSKKFAPNLLPLHQRHGSFS